MNNKSQILNSSTIGPTDTSGMLTLPPLMSNNALIKQYNQTISRFNEKDSPRQRGATSKNRNALPVSKQSKIKQVIDELYQKEKRYVK